jgi:hypothetical protein
VPPLLNFIPPAAAILAAAGSAAQKPLEFYAMIWPPGRCGRRAAILAAAGSIAQKSSEYCGIIRLTGRYGRPARAPIIRATRPRDTPIPSLQIYFAFGIRTMAQKPMPKRLEKRQSFKTH